MTLKTDARPVYLPDIVGKGYGAFWRTKKRYRVVKGSRGSKKSKTTALNLIYRIMAHRDANALVVRRWQTTLRDSCFSDLLWAMERFGVRDRFACTINPLKITYRPYGNVILFRGLDEGTKVTSISVPHGVLCYVWIEEAYECSREEDFNKLDLSIRGEMPQGLFKQITLTFNPWSANSWLKPRFFDEPDQNTFALTTTWRCNEWLDEADRQIFLDMKERNPRRYRIEGDGEWGIAEGLIYENAVQEYFDVDEVRKIDGIKAGFGLDFGFADPNAFVCSLVDQSSMTVYVFDEWYKTGCTNKEIARQIKDMGYGGERVICDSAEPKSIAELQDEGIRAEGSRKGRDSVNYGIQLLQNYRIVVHPRCKEVWREITNYCWQLDRNGRPIDKPDHEFSHGMDALRYSTGKILLPSTFSFE
ncbi:MAG: PBSX family phage terminase large subunit [Eubacteriales bacterium]|nr:PBSX family phage terminase large subunit [Eubacteriales bacterium]